MAVELASVVAPLRRRLRIDVSGPAAAEGRVEGLAFWLVLLALAGGFVLLRGGSLDLGPAEARLGLAAGERFGPLGRMYGGWEPSLWPGQVLPSALWAWLEGGMAPSSACVRWPAAIAGVVLGLLLSLRVCRALGTRAGVWMGLCWFGSLALMDRSADLEIDLVGAFGLVAALDRILSKGSDAVAGLWASLAFLAGGWPPLAVIALTTVVIGRPGTTLTVQLVLPILMTALAWSAWTLGVAPAEVWAAALALPLTQSSAWLLAPGVLLAGLPWSPLAALAASKSVRATGREPGRGLVIGWLQVTGACLLAGTLVPGLAPAARLPALVGLLVAAAVACDAAWAAGPALPAAPRRGLLGLAAGLGLLWATLAVLGCGYLAVAVAYYRPLASLLIGLGAPIGVIGLAAARAGRSRPALGVVVAVAVCLKLYHAGYHVPEWNYRFSKGPWGRAIAQWVPPRWPIYTMVAWPPDFAFALEHPVRQLSDPRLLHFVNRGGKLAFVLLHKADFEHWPGTAPKLVLVREFGDEAGGTRVLARTEGELFPGADRRP